MIACIWLYENTFSIWWEPYGKVSERRRVEEIENDAKKESGYTSSRNTSLLITLYQFFATRGSKCLFLANLKKNCRTCFIFICVRVLGVNPITCVEISGKNIKRFPSLLSPSSATLSSPFCPLFFILPFKVLSAFPDRYAATISCHVTSFLMREIFGATGLACRENVSQVNVTTSPRRGLIGFPGFSGIIWKVLESGLVKHELD